VIAPLASAMRSASPGRIAFAGVIIAVGIVGLVTGDFAPIWAPVPKEIPARAALAYYCGFISIACGAGLLSQRSLYAASGVLLAVLGLWLLLLRLAPIALQPTSQEAWSGFGETAVVTAGAWALYAGSAARRDLRGARLLYGVALIPFGIAHFRYIDATASLVPGWLPWHLFWAWFTGCAFIAAGVAMILRVGARWAVMLSTLQMGLFTALVWVPIVLSGANAFQWSEFLISVALTAGGWVVAESYRAAG